MAAVAADSATTPGGGTDRILAEVLAGVVRVEHVSADSHFFDDLGADSMVMAQFCARVRKRADLPSISMKDVYQHPTIRSLTAALEPPSVAPVEPAAASGTAATPVSTRQYVLCGTLQVLVMCAYTYVLALGFHLSFDWISAGDGLIAAYLRAVLAGGATFLGACVLPIAAKWALVGRWRPQRIPIWSLAYLRFWVVKSLVTLNPLVLFAGSPIYNLYLRALGAKVGRDVLILSRRAPTCTDLLTVGDGTVIRNHTFFTCYRAVAGMLQTGAVTLGRDVYVGEKSVLDIETAMGDGAQLGHASTLHEGQAVPAGEHWHGSPGQPTRSDYRTLGSAGRTTRRKVTHTLLQLTLWLLVYVPVTSGGLAVLFAEVPALNAVIEPGGQALTHRSFYVTVLVTSLALFFGSMLLSILTVVTVPRVLNLAIKPDRVYPLYGFHHSIHRAIVRMTNRRFFVQFFGDSSYIVGYLRCLGYRLKPVVQTGSNFGTDVLHENPYQSAVGSGTVIASGLFFVNTDYSSTSFRVSRATIGPRNFLGNHIVYPAQGRTGANCLLATKVLVPIDGEVRENVGLLGSPSFEIPRSVARDNKFQHLMAGDEFRRRLAAKNRHNLRTMAYWLLAHWVYAFGLTLFGLLAADFYADLGSVAIALGEISVIVFTLLHVVLTERAALGFRGMQPKYCSIYQEGFWESERLFKMQARPGLHSAFVGTPIQSWFWRMVGVRLGRRLFDDGCGMSEKNLVTIGDDVTLNAGSTIQCHSQEDYVFKSDRTTVGSGCTIGVGALVHYGVAMGEGAVLAPDAFLMKGEEVPPYARWGGNPAREMRPALTADR
ncbi:peptide synthetase [Actinoplanes sp. TBRC 11911]|nr:peptide synthetase [Actinoplanes sp. TBRC 11911]